MTKWQDLIEKHSKPTPWPYSIRYDKEQEIETDVLVIGGGIAGAGRLSAPLETGLK